MGDLLGDILGGINRFGTDVRGNVDNVIRGAQQGSQSVIDTAYRTVTPQSDNSGDWFGAAVRGAAAAAAPIAIPVAAGIAGATIARDMIMRSRPENDAGVTYVRNPDDPSSQPMKTAKYMEQDGGLDVQWVEPKSNRPGFKAVEDLGLDRKTQSLISEGYTPLQAVNMRMKEERNPRTLRELDWQRLQLVQNKIELSSDYHNWAQATGKEQSINPFEHEGDMALALKQGVGRGIKQQSMRSNPDTTDLFLAMPDTAIDGLEGASWDAAKRGFTGGMPEFSAAIGVVEKSRGKAGVYGTLNAKRDYADWNKARPQAQARVMSPMEILTGDIQKKYVPARQRKTEEPLQFTYYQPERAPVQRRQNATAQNEINMLRETGLMGNSLKLPRNAVNATQNLTKPRKSGKSRDTEYFYGI